MDVRRRFSTVDCANRDWDVYSRSRVDLGRDEPRLIVPQLQNTSAVRSNVGFAEVAGGSGTVNVQFLDMDTGAVVSSRDVEILRTVLVMNRQRLDGELPQGAEGGVAAA